ncbi:universal stress protein [Haloferacaceae archaeon DSL9]
MTARILVPIDGSERGTAALAHACRTYPDAELTVLFVLDPFGHYSEDHPFPDRLDDWMANLERHAGEIFEEARALAAEYDREIDTDIGRGKPAKRIVEYAADGEFDGIVLGSHGRHGVAGFLLGNTAESVVRHAPTTVTVVREASPSESN